MTCTTQTVWCAADTTTHLLVETSPGNFYIPLCHVDVPRLAELGLAIADALKRPGSEPPAAAVIPFPPLAHAGQPHPNSN